MVVVGAGVGGLATALALGRAGHQVTVIERDTLPEIDGPEEAFASERSGAPQAHQTHGFLARMVVVLRERFPDVLDDLRAAGCTVLPPALDLGEPEPGDDDLVVLVMRRTTFEWVLRRAALATPGVELRAGEAVAGLTIANGDGNGAGGSDGLPVVNGVVLEDGTRVPADIVVAATGRRGPVPAWLADAGVTVEETIRESGLVYLTRWYRLPAGVDVQFDPKLGGDLGYVKYLGVPGDGGTLSITLAVRVQDAELRSALSDPGRFEHACRALPGPDQFFALGPLEPVGGVRPMGGLLNRLRRFAADSGRPLVHGFHAVGDAHTCTNPLYGRGCSLAVVQAVLLADAVAAHPGDPHAQSAAYEAACATEIEPWYELAVQTDATGADPTGFGAGRANGDGDPDDVPDPDGDGEDGDGGDGGAVSPEAKAMGALFVAGATDPVIGRALARLWNLLETPAQLASRPDVVARMADVMSRPDDYPPPPREGPTRRELLDTLGLAEEAASHA